jgi:hypothetical protein
VKFKFLNTLYIGLVLSISTTVNVASAGIITFEDASPVNFDTGLLYQTGNFEVNHSGSFACIGECISNVSGNGTISLYSYNTSTITLSNINETFDFLGFDGGETHISNGSHFWATSIVAVGYFSGGGTITEQFDLDLIKTPLTGLQSFSATGFVNLTKVEFTGGCPTGGCNPEFSLDNLNVSTIDVPEPSTLAIFALGMIGLASRRFKKQS